MHLVKKTYSHQIYDILRDEILTGKVGCGEKLVGRELQERFGVSSTPIRDAINRLNQDGLITDITKVGARVITIDLKYALELNEIIIIITCGAARLAMEKASPDAVLREAERWIEMQRANAGADEYFLYDYKFHKVFFDFSGNEKFQDLYQQYSALYLMLSRRYHRPDISRVACIREHEAILTAYKKQSFADVANSISAHYNEAAEVLKKVLR